MNEEFRNTVYNALSCVVEHKLFLRLEWGHNYIGDVELLTTTAGGSGIDGEPGVATTKHNVINENFLEDCTYN